MEAAEPQEPEAPFRPISATIIGSDGRRRTKTEKEWRERLKGQSLNTSMANLTLQRTGLSSETGDLESRVVELEVRSLRDPNYSKAYNSRRHFTMPGLLVVSHIPTGEDGGRGGQAQQPSGAEPVAPGYF